MGLTIWANFMSQMSANSVSLTLGTITNNMIKMDNCRSNLGDKECVENLNRNRLLPAVIFDDSAGLNCYGIPKLLFNNFWMRKQLIQLFFSEARDTLRKHSEFIVSVKPSSQIFTIQESLSVSKETNIFFASRSNEKIQIQKFLNVFWKVFQTFYCLKLIFPLIWRLTR